MDTMVEKIHNSLTQYKKSIDESDEKRSLSEEEYAKHSGDIKYMISLMFIDYDLEDLRNEESKTLLALFLFYLCDDKVNSLESIKQNLSVFLFLLTSEVQITLLIDHFITTISDDNYHHLEKMHDCCKNDDIFKALEEQHGNLKDAYMFFKYFVIFRKLYIFYDEDIMTDEVFELPDVNRYLENIENRTTKDYIEELFASVFGQEFVNENSEREIFEGIYVMFLISEETDFIQALEMFEVFKINRRNTHTQIARYICYLHLRTMEQVIENGKEKDLVKFNEMKAKLIEFYKNYGTKKSESEMIQSIFQNVIGQNSELNDLLQKLHNR